MKNKVLPIALIFVILFGIICLVAWRVSASFEAHRTPPWTIMCDGHGKWSYTLADGSLSLGDFDTMAEAENQMAESKNFDANFSEEQFQKDKAERAAYFKPCMEDKP